MSCTPRVRTRTDALAAVRAGVRGRSILSLPSPSPSLRNLREGLLFSYSLPYGGALGSPSVRPGVREATVSSCWFICSTFHW